MRTYASQLAQHPTLLTPSPSKAKIKQHKIIYKETTKQNKIKQKQTHTNNNNNNKRVKTKHRLSPSAI